MTEATNLQAIGLIGLAVMGENLALNIERNGFPIAVYNRSRDKTDKFMATRAAGKQVLATYNLKDFVASLARPRKMIIMVKAGAPVDAVIDELKPLLEPGDIIIDGGNSLYTDTERLPWKPQGCSLWGWGSAVVKRGRSKVRA